ncbi:AMP-binding protein [Sneathiella chungangensis]|uniref:AMP-binding protein n=1 Tax=Sneathiella chungangensis TaxID=1418234 RepID=A0A845MCH5_9PROT|nr:AMP-binding protein [Sneathiella chungangensis]MZR21549.1 AMP-binding protein [Sneathiella chungangensis]
MMTTVYDAFCKTAAKYPDNAFLCVPAYEKRSYHPDGVEITYAEAAEEVERLRGIYRNYGFSHGNRIAFLLENRPDYLLHLLAANSLGVSCVPVNPDYLHDEMSYLLDHSDVDLVVTIEERAKDVQAAASERARPLPVVHFEKFGGPMPRPRPAPYAGKAPGLMSEVSLLYTSGTTGRPKGCILTNDYFLTAGRTYKELGGVATIREGEERVYNPLPLFHMNAGAVTFTCMILTGGCLVIPDRFHPSTWWQEIAETRATVIHYLGVVPPLLLNQPKSDLDTAHNVRFGLGAGVEPELHEVFEKRFGFPLVEVWGMTETGRIYADCIEPRQIHTRAFGRPGEMQARVVDEKGQDVPVGAEGELLVSCVGDDPRRGFFAGYLKNEEATEEAWQGGWFHTGDTVRQDESGMLYFVDRKKNIIRRSGENIAAAEVEAVLQAHDDVAKVAVIAVKDELREEEVMACIVPMEGVEQTEEKAREIFDYSNENLAYFKTPGWILFLNDLPTTGTQKIQKTKIFGADVDPRAVAGAMDFRNHKRKSK